jgi:hypothetical protein
VSRARTSIFPHPQPPFSFPLDLFRMDPYLESMEEEDSKSQQPVKFGNLGNEDRVNMTDNPMVRDVILGRIYPEGS